MMAIVFYGLVGLLFTSVGLVTGYSWALRIKWIAWPITILLVTSLTPIIVTLIVQKDFVYFNLVEFSFLLLFIALIIASIVIITRKTSITRRIVCFFAIIGLLSATWFYFYIDKELGYTLLYREKICDGFYVNYVLDNDNGYQMAHVSHERWGFVQDKFYADIDAFNLPDSIRMTFHKDSILKFLIFHERGNEDIRVDMRK